jgi:hypothetical protein
MMVMKRCMDIDTCLYQKCTQEYAHNLNDLKAQRQKHQQFWYQTAMRARNNQLVCCVFYLSNFLHFNNSFVQFDAMTDELNATASQIDVDDANNSMLSQISIDSAAGVVDSNENNNAETSNAMITDEELEAAVTAVIQQQVCLSIFLFVCVSYFVISVNATM